MKFLKIIFLVVSLFTFLSCEDLHWTDEDILKQTKEKEEVAKKEFQKQSIIEIYNKIEKEDIENKNIVSILNIHESTSQIKDKNNLSKVDKKLSNNPVSKQEAIIISEDLELKETIIIKGQKVILDMVKIQTNEHSLIIIADEFLSNHSVIQNFQENQKAKKRKDGKNGGKILILAYKASGNLKLVLNGEDGGKVSKRRVITKEEKEKLLGSNGKNGRDAIYKKFCEIESFLFLTNRRCRFECILKQTRGEDGGDGKQGLEGENGRNGGDTGIFHLKAYSLLDFHLEEVKKSVGLGSEGGKGSFGGFGGKSGRNGRDDKNLCGERLLSAKKGNKGKRGRKGKDGKNGIEGLACLEVLNNEYQVYYKIQKVIEGLTTNNKASLLNSVSNLEEIKNKEGIICH